MAKLGIDLGTSNSAAALVYQIDESKVYSVEPVDGTIWGDKVFPSYIAFDTQGNVSAVGLLARERYYNGQSDYVFRHIKRLIGRPYDYVADKIAKKNRAFTEFEGRIARADDGNILLKVGQRQINVSEVAGFLLKKILDDANAQLVSHGEEIDSVRISLPAGFEDLQRQETLKAARMAGLMVKDISVIEEPSAAAIDKGLHGATGKIIVIDVGAGTTDVVIGHMVNNGDGIKLQLTSRECDDLLGGMDMDGLILDHVLDKNPQLAEQHSQLPFNEKCRLMGKVEEAKINASRDGHGTISVVLSGKGDQVIRVRDQFDEAELNEIISPIIGGYKSGRVHKGVKIVIENALLNAAGGKAAMIDQVIKELDNIILVGGPCRMECMFDMLFNIFASNKKIVGELYSMKSNRIRDRFYMEGVARGAALSVSSSVSKVLTIVGETQSIFSYYEGGKTPLIMAGIPYDRTNGIARTVSIKVQANSNLWWMLTENLNKDMRDWSMHRHVINVPQEGELQVSIKWGEGGTELSETRIEGCGLSGPILLPAISNRTTLGQELESSFIGYLKTAQTLPDLVDNARNQLYAYMIERGMTTDEALRFVNAKLGLDANDLQKCGTINPEASKVLSDQDIQLAVNKGLFEMREETAINRGLLTQHMIDAIDAAMFALRPSVDVQDLIAISRNVLGSQGSTEGCERFRDQLANYLHQLEINPEDQRIAASTATALGLFADLLFDKRALSEDEYRTIRITCLLYHPKN